MQPGGLFPGMQAPGMTPFNMLGATVQQNPMLYQQMLAWQQMQALQMQSVASSSTSPPPALATQQMLLQLLQRCGRQQIRQGHHGVFVEAEDHAQMRR